jgi:hypothetical protein
MHLHVPCDIRRSIFFLSNWLSPTPRPVFNTFQERTLVFPQSSSVALRGGALLNRSRKAAITWDMVCPVCCLSRTHTLCHQALLDRVTACVSHTENTNKFCGCGISRLHYLGHCCQTAILHCTACCAV